MPTTAKDEHGAPAPVYESGPILVGSDGSAGGDDAVALATDLAGRSGRRILAENIPGGVGASIGLVKIAEQETAGSLVVGSPHRGRIGRALLGSVAHHVLHHAPCEVVVAPRGYAEHERRGIEKIAVAYDGTVESDAALRRAEALARGTGASLHLIVAEDPLVAGVGTNQEFTPLTDAPAVLKTALASVDPSIDADGTTLDPGWRKADKSVAAAIAKACDSAVDILVAGTRRPLDRLLLGSITAHLIDEAPCAVLVVPNEQDA